MFINSIYQLARSSLLAIYAIQDLILDLGRAKFYFSIVQFRHDANFNILEIICHVRFHNFFQLYFASLFTFPLFSRSFLFRPLYTTRPNLLDYYELYNSFYTRLYLCTYKPLTQILLIFLPFSLIKQKNLKSLS